METLENLLKSLEEIENSYSAVFDSESGQVISVGPSIAFLDKDHKVSIDPDIAEDIISGKIRISNCFVDIASGTFEIAEIKSIRKIDDVLHRIPLISFSDIDSPDLFCTVNRKNKTLKFELSTQLGGTKKVENKKKRMIHWSGDTIMNFYITKYNDPHWIMHQVEVTINELNGKSKTIKNIDVPEKFSIFTRRILKNYVIEIK